MAVWKLTPTCKDYLWGGTRLKEEYGKQSDSAVIAETWELSCHPDGDSRLAETGETLADYLHRQPSAAGTLAAAFDRFPLLIKLIDAASPLSIQVHPDDRYALAHEGQLGKTEMWYVVDCVPDAFLYYGLAKQISADEMRQAIAENTLCDLLRRVPVQKGDVFFIEAGTIHAIGAGILIAEVQQSSNVTYRVYDYGRTGPDGQPRALHVDKACDVSCLSPAPTSYDFGGRLAACRFFTVDQINLAGEQSLLTDDRSFHSLLVLEGELEVRWADGSLRAHQGDSLFVDASTPGCLLCGDALLLHTWLE